MKPLYSLLSVKKETGFGATKLIQKENLKHAFFSYIAKVRFKVSMSIILQYENNYYDRGTEDALYG